MKSAVLGFNLFVSLLAGLASATTLTIIPNSGLVSGAPGQDVGWGFSTTNDSVTQTLSFGQSFLIDETNPLLGSYTDLIGPQGGPDNYSVDIGQSWSEVFDQSSQQGLGFYSIDPSAVVGSSDSGFISVFYNFADGTPGSIEVPFTVTVTAPVPEPGAGWTMLAGCIFLLGWRAGRRRLSAQGRRTGAELQLREACR